MQTKTGIAVSPGIAIGQAVVLDAADRPIPRRPVPVSQVPGERQRLDKALKDSCHDIELLREKTVNALGSEPAKIFGFHLGMLQDKHLIEQVGHTIESERVTAEYAVYSVMRKLAQMFMRQDSRYFRDRVNDIWDLERRVLGHLIGTHEQELSNLRQDSIIIAHDLTPSQTATLDKTRIKGLATNAGGRTSHTAILAHALGIPAIVGMENITSYVNTGDTIILDGHQGLVIVDPDAAQLLEYRQQVSRMTAELSSLKELTALPARTADGTDVELLGNIEFPVEIKPALGQGAMGIGLYRTEFLYLAADSAPTEEEQYAQYTEAVKALGGKPLTIRTLDLGADKLHAADLVNHLERNPFLGCRSIRLCLQDLPLFKTQLRAILRASVHGPLQIMFPLISNVMELRQAKMILSDVMEDLDEQGIAYGQDIPVGIMVEVPSVALQAATFSREVDFFSIGTNDLIQYTVAVDRGNERIANLYSAAHPAVIHLIKDVVRAAQRAKVPVSLCGEMGGDPDFVMLLLGMGLRKLSITPPAIPQVKRIVRAVSLNQCRRVARKVLAMDSDREVLNYLRDETRRILPEVYDGRSVAK